MLHLHILRSFQVEGRAGIGSATKNYDKWTGYMHTSNTNTPNCLYTMTVLNNNIIAI